MVTGYNAYVGPRFVGVYDDPLGPDTLPNAFLNDFGSMSFTAAFDDSDNLYVGDINRGRVLVYHNPFDNPPAAAQPTPVTASPPIPQHPMTITSVHPSPPYCVMRQSQRRYEKVLELEADSDIGGEGLHLLFRMVTDGRRVSLSFSDRNQVRTEGNRITVDMSGLGPRIWRDRPKPTLTVRIVDRDFTPLSNWSPAFRARRRRRDLRHGPANAYPDADTDPNANSHADVDSDSDQHTDPDADSHGDVDADANSDGHSDADTNAHCDSVAYANPHGNAVADTKSYSDAITDPGPHCGIGANGHRGTRGDGYTESCDDAYAGVCGIDGADRRDAPRPRGWRLHRNSGRTARRDRAEHDAAPAAARWARGLEKAARNGQAA